MTITPSLWPVHLLLASALLASAAPSTRAASLSEPKATADHWLTENKPLLIEAKQRLWSLAELGLEEHLSSQCLAQLLAEHGFKVERGVAGMPTAFVASYGSGRPVVGILAEYDALPGLSQTTSPTRETRPGSDNGHGCGHCLFGAGSCGAALAVREALEKHHLHGTIRLYGTPAEETLIGKVYMAKAGLFDDCDAILHWHPGDKTDAAYETTKAMVSVKFTFSGVAAHASSYPERGKSALDGVELMDVGANFWREHLPEDARIHYVITDGGGQPNVVPPRAEVWYYLRANEHRQLETMFERLIDIAKGAALMTATTVQWKIDSDTHEVLPNLPLARLVDQNLSLLGPPQFTEAEKDFARQTQTALGGSFECALSEKITPLSPTPEKRKGSTDVGEISWRVPTASLNVASWTFGAPTHSWQVVACAGGSIGEKGMLLAARTLAFTALDLFTDPSHLVKAREDFEARRGPAALKSLLPTDQLPPVKVK